MAFRKGVCWTILLIAGLLIPICSGQEAPAESPASPEKIPASEAPGPLTPGNHTRTLMMGKQKRTYLVHVPVGYDPTVPAPVVLALHGAAMNGSMMVWFSGLNKTSDAHGFVVVYPSGTGTGPFLAWNAGGFTGRMNEGRPDDVAFIGELLDELETLVSVDDQRVYACGMSNGGMMCYRLALELSERIAAIAPVAGTMAIAESELKRAVPVIHFHGTKDTIVPYGFPKGKSPPFMTLKGVDDTIQTWVRLNACQTDGVVDILSKEGDKTRVTRTTYPEGKEGAEVVLVAIEGGGHTWPGQQPPVGFIGKSAKNISANELIWEFFQKHPLR